MSRDGAEKNERARAGLASKSVALKSHKFQHIDRVCAMRIRVWLLCPLEDIRVSADLSWLNFAHFWKQQLFIYCVFNLFVRCIHRAAFTVVAETMPRCK